MKNIILLLCLSLALNCCKESSHPRIYITNGQKSAFAGKLQTVDRAKRSYEKIKSAVDPYVDRHQTDPE
ncbi:MAG: hypothetical protein LBL24_08840, partial [Bacteroidales bacterium]|nr:hypothetical protein [Bacteroidales bacterium]